VLDPAGNVYGTTLAGGDFPSNCAENGCGVAFKVDTRGHETVLQAFAGLDGYEPYAGLVRDSTGVLFGATFGGGIYSGGRLFKLMPQSTFCAAALCPWNETPIYDFGGFQDDGIAPYSVMRDPAGNFYGTTQYGGGNHCGVVFKVDPQGNETILHDFQGPPNDGCTPLGTPTLDAQGNLYGTTEQGGAGNCSGNGNGCGIVFQIDAGGNYSIIHTFAGGSSDGSYSYSGLVPDADGNLYGTTSGGGFSAQVCYGLGCGVVYKLAPNADGTWTETILHSFTAGSDGAVPLAALLLDNEGNLYGTTLAGGLALGLCNYQGSGTCGVVFKLDAAGDFTTLWSFTGGRDGQEPSAPLVMDGQGDLYGTATYGGDLSATNPVCFGLGCGVVFKLTP
jgi:uncharacterized repeat protein (TIGR03803 family)